MAKKWKITRESSKDKRTISSTTKQLSALEKFKPSEIAKQLKISYQKWTAVKKDIKAGKIYGPDARDQLKQIATKIQKPVKQEVDQDQRLTRAEKKRAREIIREMDGIIGGPGPKRKRNKKEYQYSKKTKRNLNYDDEALPPTFYIMMM